MATPQRKAGAPIQYNKGSPGVRRILKEAQEIVKNPSPDFTAAPLETNLFEWHFTLKGPPAPSPFADGFYHGRIILSPNYPMRPPMFRFLTDSGRFEVNRDICLSISGFHEETWQPSWSIRLALTALRAFMDTDPEGQVGGLECTPATRKELAAKSKTYKCSECGGGGAEDEKNMASEEATSSDVVPEELRFGYKDQMKPKQEDGQPQEGGDVQPGTAAAAAAAAVSPAVGVSSPAPAPAPQQQQQQAPLVPTPTVRQEDQQEPAMFIPFASPGQHQPVVNRPVAAAANRAAVPGGHPGAIAPPAVTAAVPAPAPLALVNGTNDDRTIGYLDFAIATLLGVVAYLIIRKM